MVLKRQKWLVSGNVFFFILTLLCNYASSTGMLSQLDVGDVSDKYFTFLTPADYAFAIWGLIYLSLTLFLIIQIREVFIYKRAKRFISDVNYLFMMTCLFNSSWILLWVNEYILASVVVISLLLLSLIAIVFRLCISTVKYSLGKYLWVIIPFSLYFGWVLIATVVNVSAFLDYLQIDLLMEWQYLLRYIVIGIATVLYLLVLWLRNSRLAVVVGIWGITAVGVNFFEGDQAYAYFCIASSLILLLNIIFHLFIKGINLTNIGILNLGST